MDNDDSRIRGRLCPSLIGRGNLYDIIVAMATIMTSTSILCPSLNQKHEAPSPHITTRGSIHTHYHMRLRPHTLPHEAPSPHITTRGSVPTHYHTMLRPHTLPHEAPSPHITTRGCVSPHYHMRLCPPILPHEAQSTHIATRAQSSHCY
ncbi:unnamed protein product [Ranitomeya imitator]|uniref:Uncharacterized protein n=1 Tax=Ranitomeya imitator TaxID=111125 RepID=A0ABN9MQB1_9NEOB|nr:unnamed protein product [Ranitomeya imitator]